MNAFEWQTECLTEMKTVAHYQLDDWSDLGETILHIWDIKHYTLRLERASYLLGLKATVTLQLPDDERKVRLLKDGQPEDELEQCYSCIHGVINYVEDPDYEDIFCEIGHDMSTCRYCIDWKKANA